MQKEDITRLYAENHMAEEAEERDCLTGLYNHGTIEKKIDMALENLETATLFIIDVDRFKEINDTCGHLVGDRVLKEIGNILNGMFYGKSMAGRVDGNKFVAFIPENIDWQMVENRLAELSYSLVRVGRRLNLSTDLTVTVGAAWGNERYSVLFRRAGDMLADEKEKKKNMPEYRQRRIMRNGVPIDKDSLDKDMELISNELHEDGTIKGACCYSYDAFRHIFRFVERGLKRSSQKAYVLLLTLTNGKGELPPLAGRSGQMQELETVISGSLRTGDVFTRYSSGQFLLMVLDVSEENAMMIGERICKRFYEKLPEGTDLRLCRQLYPMQAAGSKAEWC